ncbi:IS5 family transposase [bacterium]|nr:IS5 family transposase [bacterium]
MRPKKSFTPAQLFQSRLDQILNLKHPLIVLAHEIDWSSFENAFGSYYCEYRGRTGAPIRLMVGLHYLKHAFDCSDESVVAGFVENPYWQYFCGYDYFQHEFPIDPSSLTRWRKRVGDAGIEKLLEGLLQTAKRAGYLRRSDVNRVNVDTTVQEKAIAFPTDARLYHKMRATLVRAAEARGIKLRQSYRRLSKQALAKQGRYSHARQMKRSRKMTRKLKTYLGCVARDIARKSPQPDDELKELLAMAERLLLQQRQDKNKLYSIHAPEVECISKGKAHKRYEFGCKVSMLTSANSNWILGISAMHGNPYDGHTLKEALEQVERLAPWQPKVVTADRGYRGHNYQGTTEVQIVNYRTIKSKTRSVRKWFKRRAAIEPIFGHLKSGNRMSRNYLKGADGDKINALLCGCGFNFRKLLKAFWRWLEKPANPLQMAIKVTAKLYGTPRLFKLRAS